MTVLGYWLQIDGFPYILGTRDLPDGGDYVPEDDAPTYATFFSGRLDPPRGTISEEIEPVTGALRAGSMTFTLTDDPADPVLDELLTLDPRRQITGTIASTVSATETEIGLNSPVPSSISGLSFPAVVWIDEEAILVDSYAANTLSNCARGVYGTRAAIHRVDSELGQYPEVWATFPTSIGRRVILWAVDDGSPTVLQAVWRGYLRAPRLAADGAKYELPCEHLSTWEMQRPAGGLTYSVRLIGYNSRCASFRFLIPDAYNGGVNDGEQYVSTFHPWADVTPTAHGTTRRMFDDFLQWSRDTLATRLSTSTLGGVTKTAQTNVTVRIDRIGSNVTFECGASNTGAGVLAATDVVQPAVSVLLLDQEQQSPAAKRPGLSGFYRGTINVSFPTAALLGRSDRAMPLPVERLDGLPSTFDTATTYSDPPYATRIRPILTAPFDDSTRLVILPESSTANDSTIGGGPSVTGTVRYVDSRNGDASVISSRQRKIFKGLGVNSSGYSIKRDTGATLAFIDKSVRVNYGQWVTTDHWVYGLKRALEDSNVSTGSDARNWDWNDADEIAQLTSGDLSSREWFLDGARSVKELLGDSLTLDGCALSVGPHGRLKIVPMRPAQFTWDAADVAFEVDCAGIANVSTRVPIVKGTKPQWTLLSDALTNVVSLASDSVDVTVRDIRSFQRYGQRANLDLKIEGIPLNRQNGEDPRAIAQRLLQRIVGIWSEPIAQVQVTIPAINRSGTALWFGDASTSIYPGRFVILRNAWNVPTGDGTRGMDLRAAFVAGRRVNLSNNTIDLTLWMLREVYAYAPCVKVASVNAASGIVTAATGYVRMDHADETDYAGGELGTGGVSGFEAGDKVRLIVRDSMSPSQETYTVQSVDSVAGTITMTTAIATAPYNWPTLASTGWVDLIPATYTTCQTSQRYHQFVGDGSAAEGLIGASSDQSREFAP